MPKLLLKSSIAVFLMKINNDQLFGEVLLAKEYLQSNWEQWKQEETTRYVIISSEEKWVRLFGHFNDNRIAPNLIKIVEYAFCLPGTSAPVREPRRVRLTSANVRYPRPKPETTGKVHKLRPNTRLAMVLRQHVRRDNGNGANNKNQFVTFAARQGPKRKQIFQDFMKGLIETKNPTQNSVQFSLALLQNVSPMSDLFADDTRQSSNNGNDNAPNQEAQTDSSNPDILADVERQVSSDMLVEAEPQSTLVAGDNQGDLEGITSNENIDIPSTDHTTSHSYNGDNLYSSDARNHSEEDRKWLQYAVEQLNKEESVYTCILGQMHLNECELGGIRTHTISAEDARQCLLYLSRGDPWDILNLTKIMEKLFVVKTVLKKLQILHKDPLQLERKQIINLLGLYLKKYFTHLKKPLVSTDALLQRHI